MSMTDVTVDETLRPWQIDEADFPVGGMTADLFRFVVGYGVLAPSSHNSQPWRFRVDDAHLDVYADWSRSLPVVDPGDRELTISCGAAVEHIRLALAHSGYRCTVDHLPAPKDPALLARIALAGSAPATSGDEQLFKQIVRRRTNRGAFHVRPVEAETLRQLQDDATVAGAWLHVVQTAMGRMAVAQLVARGDLAQMHDSAFRRELADWVRGNHSGRADGIRGYGLGLGDLHSMVEPTVIRRFDVGPGRAADDRELAEASPALAVLGTDRDDQDSWLRAGIGLARLLLRARAHDVWASFLNQPVEVPELREELAAMVRRPGSPQLVLRLGYGTAPVLPEPRRPVSDVLTVD